ncbi:MAG: hypothetical protein ABIQ12_02020 [Opitutaceae bacterium]
MKEDVPVFRIKRAETDFEVVGPPETGVCEKVEVVAWTVKFQLFLVLVNAAWIAVADVTEAMPVARLKADAGTDSVTVDVIVWMLTDCDQIAGRKETARTAAAKKRNMAYREKGFPNAPARNNTTPR